MTLIFNKIYIGDIDDAHDKKFDIIINMCNEPLDIGDAKNKDTMIFNICTLDSPRFNMTKYFPYTNLLLQRAEFENKKILVNCHAGISRSVTIVVAYLINRYHMTPNKALHFIKQKRNFINPNKGFIKQLNNY